MTLNSEGLEKALPCAFCQGEIFVGEVQKPDGTGGWKKSGYRASCRSCEMSMKEATTKDEAISAWNRRALPPVDGLEVVMEKICHKEQIGIWANEITSALALSDFLREEWTFDDSVDLDKEIAAQLLDIIKSAFTHPGLDLVASLSQASSVIAGLKAEVADLRDEWQAEYDARLAANTARRAAEARISSLEEQNKRLREALKPFAAVAEHDIGDDETDDDIFWPISNARYSMSSRLRVGHLRAARQVLEDHNG